MSKASERKRDSSYVYDTRLDLLSLSLSLFSSFSICLSRALYLAPASFVRILVYFRYQY